MRIRLHTPIQTKHWWREGLQRWLPLSPPIHREPWAVWEMQGSRHTRWRVGQKGTLERNFSELVSLCGSVSVSLQPEVWWRLCILIVLIKASSQGDWGSNMGIKRRDWNLQGTLSTVPHPWDTKVAEGCGCGLIPAFKVPFFLNDNLKSKNKERDKNTRKENLGDTVVSLHKKTMEGTNTFSHQHLREWNL